MKDWNQMEEIICLCNNMLVTVSSRTWTREVLLVWGLHEIGYLKEYLTGKGKNYLIWKGEEQSYSCDAGTGGCVFHSRQNLLQQHVRSIVCFCWKCLIFTFPFCRNQLQIPQPEECIFLYFAVFLYFIIFEGNMDCKHFLDWIQYSQDIWQFKSKLKLDVVWEARMTCSVLTLTAFHWRWHSKRSWHILTSVWMPSSGRQVFFRCSKNLNLSVVRRQKN